VSGAAEAATHRAASGTLLLKVFRAEAAAKPTYVIIKQKPAAGVSSTPAGYLR
jgi:hypothetical protein